MTVDGAALPGPLLWEGVSEYEACDHSATNFVSLTAEQTADDATWAALPEWVRAKGDQPRGKPMVYGVGDPIFCDLPRHHSGDHHFPDPEHGPPAPEPRDDPAVPDPDRHARAVAKVAAPTLTWDELAPWAQDRYRDLAAAAIGSFVSGPPPVGFAEDEPWVVEDPT